MRELASGNGYFAIARGPECLPSRSLLGLKRRPAPVFHRSPGDPGLSLREVIGRDPVMNRNAEAARRLIDSDVPFLLSGESGVGKASFARALHRESKRSERSLVVVNCVTLSEQHGETELFGCRGLAAGGPIGCRGHIAQAHGGTLYLDEVGKLPSSLQTRLLRVLEDRELVPVGGERPLPMDVQVIASSRAVLKELVSRGTLCEDLYYRLDGATLELPALRERVDIKELIDAIVDLENSTERPLVVEPAAMTRLLEYDWPGNLRQLRAVMRRAVALCVDSRIRLGDLPATLGGTERPEWTPVPAAAAARLPGAGFAVGASGRLEEAERMALLRELELRRWNVTTTAAALSISRNTLYRRMKRLGIPPSQRLLKELN
jgi:transcriptional regulator of acetoin/glycerol metabolism